MDQVLSSFSFDMWDVTLPGPRSSADVSTTSVPKQGVSGHKVDFDVASTNPVSSGQFYLLWSWGAVFAAYRHSVSCWRGVIELIKLHHFVNIIITQCFLVARLDRWYHIGTRGEKRTWDTAFLFPLQQPKQNEAMIAKITGCEIYSCMHSTWKGKIRETWRGRKLIPNSHALNMPMLVQWWIVHGREEKRECGLVGAAPERARAMQCDGEKWAWRSNFRYLFIGCNNVFWVFYGQASGEFVRSGGLYMTSMLTSHEPSLRNRPGSPSHSPPLPSSRVSFLWLLILPWKLHVRWVMHHPSQRYTYESSFYKTWNLDKLRVLRGSIRAIGTSIWYGYDFKLYVYFTFESIVRHGAVNLSGILKFIETNHIKTHVLLLKDNSLY